VDIQGPWVCVRPLGQEQARAERRRNSVENRSVSIEDVVTFARTEMSK